MAAPLKLAAATAQRAGTPNAMRTGIVVGVSAAGVEVNVGGGVITAGLIGGAGAGVAPGAVVSVFKQGSSWQVQGVVMGPGQSPTGTPTQPLPATNALILPPVDATIPGSLHGAGIVTSLLSSAPPGTYALAPVIKVLLPKGHLCHVRCDGVQTSVNTPPALAVLTVRDGSTIYAEFEMVNSFASLGQRCNVQGYCIGDGLVHTLQLYANPLISGTTTSVVKQPVTFFMGVVDLGDASGVSAL